jgi:hypothetical protein
MTPQEALAIMARAAAVYHGTRQDHTTLLQAEAVLKELVERLDNPAPVSEPEKEPCE